MSDKDVTSLVDFGNNDDESLPLKKCVCGKTFEDWSFILGIYRDNPDVCPSCGRKLYFSFSIKVYEVDEAQPLPEE